MLRAPYHHDFVSATGPFRILHADGDSFFASCEIALAPDLAGRPVWVGGGRRGDGIVIAANRLAKKFGVKTGMACFEAKRLCPQGVLCRPHYDEYRRLSQEMFRILEEYTPTLVPTSIDEGFLDFTGMDCHVWRRTTPADYVNGIRERILTEVGIPVSAGLASCSQLAKLATDAGKPGFLEIPVGQEKDFLADRLVRDLSGIGERLERSLPRWALARSVTSRSCLPGCSARSSASGANSSGCSPTANGASRCCWRSRTAPPFRVTLLCPTTSRTTKPR